MLKVSKNHSTLWWESGKFSKASGALLQTPLESLQRPPPPPPQTPSWKRVVLRTACLASQDLPSSFFAHSSCFGRTSFFFVVTALCMQVLTVWDITCTFLPKPVQPRTMEFWRSQIWEKRIILGMLCWIQELIQELSVHTHDAVCGSLWATSQSTMTRDILPYLTVGDFFFVTNANANEYGGKFSLWSSTTSRSALWSSQVFRPITSFLPWRGDACLMECIFKSAGVKE